MANLAQTVANSLLVLGMSPTNFWNALEWGTDNWGNDGNVCKEVRKGIANSVSMVDSIGKQYQYTLANSITVAPSITTLSRGYGDFQYVATRPTVNWVSQVVDSSTQVSDPEDDSTAVADPSTTWTRVT